MKPKKRAKIPATAIADVMGLIPPTLPGHPEPERGVKAITGQYLKAYTRVGHVTPGRVSKGCQKRYDRDHGTEGKMDMAESINARR